MPHVIVKLYAGRSEQQKAKLAEEVTKAIMIGANCTEEAVSVSIEDVAPDDVPPTRSTSRTSLASPTSSKSRDTTPSEDGSRLARTFLGRDPGRS